MHSVIVAAGVILVLVILVHMLFRIIKFTIIICLLGAALILVMVFFQTYLGIDLMDELARHS